MRNFATQIVLAGASLFCTAGLVAFSDPALAETPVAATRQVTVSYNPADLASDAGRAQIASRIRIAAARVCETSDASDWKAENACRRDAVTHADAALSTAFAERTDATVEIAAK